MLPSNSIAAVLHIDVCMTQEGTGKFISTQTSTDEVTRPEMPGSHSEKVSLKDSGISTVLCFPKTESGGYKQE